MLPTGSNFVRVQPSCRSKSDGVVGRIAQEVERVGL
jgi:hypothetical protein